jgi:hypothetical protein
MRSSLEDAILVFSKFHTERSPVSFSFSCGGVSMSARGRISEASTKCLRVDDSAGCVAFVDWSRCEIQRIEYFEPKEVSASLLAALKDRAPFVALSIWQVVFESGDFFILAEIERTHSKSD